MMYVEQEPEPEANEKEEGLTTKQVATYAAAGLGLVATIGGAIVGIGGGMLPNTLPPPGTDPQPAYVIETEQAKQGNVIDMGDYQVTLPSSIPLNYAAQDDQAEGKEWTILVYSAADNNLEAYQVADVDDMEKIGSTDNADVIVQLDRGEKADGKIDMGKRAWTGARRYHLQKDGTKGELNSPVLGELGQIDMADPANLQDFVEWGVQNFPAKNYMLVISDHGMGWTGSIIDDSAGTDSMTWAQVQEALGKVQQKTGVKIDVLGYDACLMESAEGAYQVRSVTDFLVASEENEGAEGWPYEGIMGNRALVVMEKYSKAFKDGPRPELSPKLMSYLIVKEAENDQQNLRTLSATEVAKMPKVAEAVDGLADALLGSKVPMEEFNKANDASLHFGTNPLLGFPEPLVDLGDLAERLAANEKYEPAVRDAANKVIKSIGQVVVAEQHNAQSHGTATGLHIYVPSVQREYDHYKQLYEATGFAEDTSWDELMQKRNPTIEEAFELPLWLQIYLESQQGKE